MAALARAAVSRARLTRAALGAAGIGLVLAAWEVLGRAVGEAMLAPPSIVAAEALALLGDRDALVEIGGSLRLMAAGFGLSCALGMPVGVVMGRSALADRLLHPWVSMAVVTSVASLIPLLIVLLGPGVTFRLTVVVVASVFYVIVTTYQGARGIDPRWLEVGRAFASGRLQLFWKVMLPALLPYLIAAGRVGFVQSLRGAVVAEMYVIVGFGGLLHNAGLYVSTGTLLALLLVLMAVGLLGNALLSGAIRVLAPWSEARADGA